MAAKGLVKDAGGKEFDPELALTMIQTSVSDNGEISLPTYVVGLDEIYRLLGQRLFVNFEGQDMLPAVDVRMTILRDLCVTGETREHYGTVQSMVDHESQNGLIESQNKPSGTLTLLRIHRMMDFICGALDKYNDLTVQDEAMPSEIVKVYTRTTGRYHPQLMLASIQWALLQIVPSRRALEEGIGLGDASGRWMTDMSQALKKCYDAIQKVYSDRGLLNLSQGSL